METNTLSLLYLERLLLQQKRNGENGMDYTCESLFTNKMTMYIAITPSQSNHENVPIRIADNIVIVNLIYTVIILLQLWWLVD